MTFLFFFRLRRCLVCLFAGIRFGAFAARALPLCGAAVTFFAAPQRK